MKTSRAAMPHIPLAEGMARIVIDGKLCTNNGEIKTFVWFDAPYDLDITELKRWAQNSFTKYAEIEDYCQLAIDQCLLSPVAPVISGTQEDLQYFVPDNIYDMPFLQAVYRDGLVRNNWPTNSATQRAAEKAAGRLLNRLLDWIAKDGFCLTCGNNGESCCCPEGDQEIISRQV